MPRSHATIKKEAIKGTANVVNTLPFDRTSPMRIVPSTHARYPVPK